MAPQRFSIERRSEMSRTYLEICDGMNRFEEVDHHPFHISSLAGRHREIRTSRTGSSLLYSVEALVEVER